MATVSAAPPRGELLKILGTGFGVAVSVGAIIGSGILRAPSAIAGEVPGLWLVLGLWLLGGVQATLSANIYNELATALPKTGGQYIWAQHIYGDIGGLLVGWADWLSFMAATAAASVSFAEFLPLVFPAFAAHKIAVAIALQLSIYGANIVGLRQGRSLQIATSVIKTVMLFVFILAAVLAAAPAEPRVVLASPAPLLSLGGAVLAYKLVVGAYGGWNVPAYFAGENTSPSKSIPRAIYWGLALTTTLYVGINAALFSALGQAGVASSPLPFTAVLDRFGGPLPSLLFALTAMVTVASCANSQAMGAPRILFALAENGLLPSQLRRVNRGGSPWVALILCAIFSLSLAMTGAFVLVFGLIATLNTANAVLLEAGFFLLRRREPGLARPYRACLYPWVPLLALTLDTIFLCLIAFADHLGVLVAVGLALLCIPLALVARRARTAATA